MRWAGQWHTDWYIQAAVFNWELCEVLVYRFRICLILACVVYFLFPVKNITHDKFDNVDYLCWVTEIYDSYWLLFTFLLCHLKILPCPGLWLSAPAMADIRWVLQSPRTKVSLVPDFHPGIEQKPELSHLNFYRWGLAFIPALGSHVAACSSLSDYRWCLVVLSGIICNWSGLAEGCALAVLARRGEHSPFHITLNIL